MTHPHRPLRLTVDRAALQANWRWLKAMSGGAECGAAVKADGYGIGAAETVGALREAGCRHFFVSSWAEAAPLAAATDGVSLSVLHGVGEADLDHARSSAAKPVLNTPEQVTRWRDGSGGRPCDVMVDTGMNRLGLSAEEAGSGLLNGLRVETMMSHLACADEDVAANGKQLAAFRAIAAAVPAERYSLANSAGICLGPDYRFDLTRPGLALYGGVPRREAEGRLKPVVRLEAQILQRRRVEAGDEVGYNATYTAPAPTELAIVNLGYADGYLRGFSGTGRARIGEAFAPVVGRVSMDLTAICVDADPTLREGNWLEMEFDLPAAAAQSGLSQYELLTSLGHRFERRWS